MANRLRLVLSNFGWLSLGRLLGDMSIFAMTLVVSHWHGELGLGNFAFAMAVTLIYAIAADLGIYQMLLREQQHHENRDVANIFIGRIVTIGLILSSLSLLALIITANIMPFSQDFKWIIIFVGITQLFQRTSEGLSYILLIHAKTHMSGMVEMTCRCTAALFTSLLIMFGLPFSMCLAALAFCAMVRLMVMYYIVWRLIGKIFFRASLYELITTVMAAKKYMASVVQLPIYARTDVVLLGVFVDAAAVGLYNAAFRIVMLLNIVVSLAATALFPIISELYVSSRQEFGAVYTAALRAGLLIALPCAAGLCLVAPDVIVILFGADFMDSAILLRILCWLVVAFTLRALSAAFLVVCGLQASRAKIEWLGTVTMLTGCFALVAGFGVVGAAATVLFVECGMAAAMVTRVARLLGWPEVGSRIFISILGIAGFTLPILVWPWLPIILMVPLATVIYGGVLALSSDIRNTEYRLLRDILVGGRG